MVSLDEARSKALENQRLAREGRDPVAERNATNKILNFQAFAEQVIKRHVAKRVSPKSLAHWQFSFESYAYPRLGRMRMDHIKPVDIVDCLFAIWNTKPKTASRVLQRITTIVVQVLGYGYCHINSGKFAKDSLDISTKIVQHLRAVQWADVPATVRQIRATDAFPTTKLPLEFLILTVPKSGEVKGATWDEIDIDEAKWTVPATRMKARTEHNVPLPDRYLKILDEAKALTDQVTTIHIERTFSPPSATTLKAPMAPSRSRTKH